VLSRGNEPRLPLRTHTHTHTHTQLIKSTHSHNSLLSTLDTSLNAESTSANAHLWKRIELKKIELKKKLRLFVSSSECLYTSVQTTFI